MEMNKMYEKLDKKEREILFLSNVENKSKEELLKFYLELKLNDKSKNINLRIFERLIGVYSKYDEAKKIEVKNELIKNLVKVNINYEDLVENLIYLKEKIKRSNRVKNLYDLKELEKFVKTTKK